MKMEDLFSLALGLQTPWQIDNIEFVDAKGGRQLHIHLGHIKGASFSYEGKQYSVYDHQKRTWRHLNFFEHECYLHARVPRVKTDSNQVLLVEVPWASPGSSFTLLFQLYAALLVQGGMPMSKAGLYMGISGKRIWTIIDRLVTNALVDQQLEDVEHLGMDETSSRKGHNYLTVLTDVKLKKVVGLGEGKDVSAAQAALLEMEVRGADSKKVKVVTMDMSHSYISAKEKHMGQAATVFDRFHIEQSMNKVVDTIRREESRNYKDLKNTRYLWLRNQSNLKQRQKEKIDQLAESYPALGKCYRLKEQLKQVLNEAKYNESTKPLEDWLDLAWDSEILKVQSFVKSIERHWYGIKTYFEYCLSNGYAERVNLKIQEIKRVAKGYRNINNFKTMIYFHLGGLNLNLPTKYG